jgi:hypothetical protein
MQQNVGPAFPRIRVKIVFEVDLVATDGTRLPIIASRRFLGSSQVSTVLGRAQTLH